LVAELAVVHDPANGRRCRRRDFHQIELFALGEAERLGRLEDTELSAVSIDHADLACVDLVVDAGLGFLAAYGTPPRVCGWISLRAFWMISGTDSAASVPAPRRRGATVLDATSFSPITNTNGIFWSSASRIL